MYYNRRISCQLSKLIEIDGDLRWLFDFVKQHKELDFLIGRNNSKEWISVYRGLSRILIITGKEDYQYINLNADKAYKEIGVGLYGNKMILFNFKKELENLLSKVAGNNKFNQYYDNKKEGYFQNELSRRYGICGKEDDEFVIIDKEAVIGYSDINEKKKEFGSMQKVYKNINKFISDKDEIRYGRNLAKKAIGNELDFIALDKNGNILLIEYKHGTNTSGIYLSPVQIGMYYDLFNSILRKDLINAVNDMFCQKQKIGLINTKWKKPVIKNIIPVLIISEYKDKSCAKIKFQEILKIIRAVKGHKFLSNLKTYNYTLEQGMTNWLTNI